MRKHKVLLVYPQFPASYWGFQYALRLFGRKSMHSPLSLVTAAALCPDDWEYRLVDLNVEPLSDEQILWADLVFTTAMGIQARSLEEVLSRCRRLGRRTVLGGPFASGSADRLLGRADTLVLDEAEITIRPFLHDLEQGPLAPMYRADRKPDVTTSPVPRFDLLKLAAYSVIDIQYSRGCPFNCEFCDIIQLYGRLPRTKSPQQIIAEFEALYALGYRGPIFLVDDNFIGNKKNVRVLLKEIIPWQQKRDYPFFLTTEASVNLGEDLPLLTDMRLAGFKRVFVGVETPSLESLRETQKYQNTRKDLAEAIHTIIDSGLEVSGGFIVGFDNDTADIFDRQVEFIKKAAIPWAMVGTLIAIPATQLWTRLEREGRLLGYADGDQFGRPNFVTRLDPDVLYSGYLRILETLYRPDAYYDRVLTVLERHESAGHPNLHARNYPLGKILMLLAMCVVVLGIKADYRRSFWRYFLAVVRRFPHRLVQGLINAVIGHHFILYTREVLTRTRALKPLERPAAVAVPAVVAAVASVGASPEPGA
jgi:radical SAM superfamily enzyme YgiQ (UPF0313 family)